MNSQQQQEVDQSAEDLLWHEICEVNCLIHQKQQMNEGYPTQADIPESDCVSHQQQHLNQDTQNQEDIPESNGVAHQDQPKGISTCNYGSNEWTKTEIGRPKCRILSVTWNSWILFFIESNRTKWIRNIQLKCKSVKLIM